MKMFSGFGWLFAVLLFTHTSYAQLSIGMGGGVDIDTDATLAGLQLRMPVMGVTVGMTFDFGKGNESIDLENESAGKREQHITRDYNILRLTAPIGYAFALGESGDITIMPFAAPGWYSFQYDFSGAPSSSHVSLDLGVEARYNIVFVNGFVGVLENHPNYGFRAGFLFTIGE